MNKYKTLGIIGVTFVFLYSFGFVSGIFMERYIGEEKREEEKVPTIVQNAPPEIDRDRRYGMIPINPYITENFVKEDLFMVYYDEDNKKISHPGIDVSSYQKNINWKEVKEAGVEFVFVRLGYRGYTEGKLVLDDMFHSHMKGAKKEGLHTGIYFFSQAINEKEAVEEAEFVLKHMQGYELSYPVVYDTEFITDSKARTRQEEITREDRSRMCIAFCETIKEAGYYPMIYCNENWIRRYLDYAMLEDYDFWVPQYNALMDFMYDFTIWQYSEGADIPGIEGLVDANISLIDYASFLGSQTGVP
ncbi:MAG: Lyzozyme M1 (1,4-beta-N-acetylmuramidase) [Lachnospiraceae bacterium]|jgi:lysozyme|nr:Lyzozyme M1 (1,4-beta-N-acetylmuramidase) [Lachnospiraceae bacterium]